MPIFIIHKDHCLPPVYNVYGGSKYLIKAAHDANEQRRWVLLPKDISINYAAGFLYPNKEYVHIVQDLTAANGIYWNAVLDEDYALAEVCRCIANIIAFNL